MYKTFPAEYMGWHLRLGGSVGEERHVSLTNIYNGQLVGPNNDSLVTRPTASNVSRTLAQR